MKIAIISPSQNAYSETFIQAHKNRLAGTIHYLYGGYIPTDSEFTGRRVLPRGFWEKVIFNFKYYVAHKGLSKIEFALKLYLKKHKIQCVLAEYGITGGVVYKITRQLNIPLIVYFLGYDISVKKVLETNKHAYQKMFAYASFLLGVSKPILERLKELGAEKEKLIYNPCAPDDMFFKVEHNTNQQKIFFALGRFVDKKAPYYTIIAFNKVLKKYPEAKLVLAGAGPLLDVCINLVRYLGIQENVAFPGVITPEKERVYMSKAVAFVQHSITARNGDSEGTPVAVLEASAAGLPVISTLHAGIPDVIIHKKTGLLCPEHDYEQMAQNMIWILENPDAAKKMGLEGRDNVIKNFSMESHINNLNKTIEKAVNNW